MPIADAHDAQSGACSTRDSLPRANTYTPWPTAYGRSSSPADRSAPPHASQRGSACDAKSASCEATLHVSAGAASGAAGMLPDVLGASVVVPEVRPFVMPMQRVALTRPIAIRSSHNALGLRTCVPIHRGVALQNRVAARVVLCPWSGARLLSCRDVVWSRRKGGENVRITTILATVLVAVSFTNGCGGKEAAGTFPGGNPKEAADASAAGRPSEQDGGRPNSQELCDTLCASITRPTCSNGEDIVTCRSGCARLYSQAPKCRETIDAFLTCLEGLPSTA